jgi:hypothetical protein
MNRLSILRVGLVLGLFLVISYALCVGYGLLVPEQFRMHTAWEALLPGFTWLSPVSFFIGLVESFAYGFYISVVFVPIYNWLGRGSRV